MLESIGYALNHLPALLKASIVTIQITAFSVVFGLIGGTFLGVSRLSSFLPVRWASRIYVEFFRGTPLLVQIVIIYFGFPAVVKNLGFQFSFDKFVAAVIALGLNSAAYIGEIVRAGIQSIDSGQREASECLGLGPFQTMRYIIFPQAFRRMIPPLSNEFTTLLKDTSLVQVIAYEELFTQGKLIAARDFRWFEVFITVALIYLVMNTVASQGFILLERWMDPLRKTEKQSTNALANALE